jgi:hypothetical protein
MVAIDHTKRRRVALVTFGVEGMANLMAEFLVAPDDLTVEVMTGTLDEVPDRLMVFMVIGKATTALTVPQVRLFVDMLLTSDHQAFGPNLQALGRALREITQTLGISQHGLH